MSDKLQTLQYLLLLNQQDGRRSGVMSLVAWALSAVAFATSVLFGYLLIQALIVPGADWVKVGLSGCITFAVVTMASWAKILSRALVRSSTQARESYFALQNIDINAKKGALPKMQRMSRKARKRLLREGQRLGAQHRARRQK